MEGKPVSPHIQMLQVSPGCLDHPLTLGGRAGVQAKGSLSPKTTNGNQLSMFTPLSSDPTPAPCSGFTQIKAKTPVKSVT